MNALLIVNPAAGQGRPSELLPTLHAALGPLVTHTHVTQGPGDAQNAARDAALSGAWDAVLVAGGDGTMNEAINGLLSASVPSPLPLGIVPIGTQNVLAHELGIPRHDLSAVAALLRAGNLRPIDAGRAADTMGERFFCLMAGFGFDAAVVHEVVGAVKDVIGPAAYAFATLSALAKYRSTSLTLRLDSEDVHSEAFAVVVANAASYAFRQVKMTPFASVDDGWLDVCVFERAPTDKVGFVTQVLAMLARRHLSDPRVRYYRARRVEIGSDPPIGGQLDGDAFRPTPMSIEIVPRALSVFVP